MFDLEIKDKSGTLNQIVNHLSTIEDTHNVVFTLNYFNIVSWNVGLMNYLIINILPYPNLGT